MLAAAVRLHAGLHHALDFTAWVHEWLQLATETFVNKLQLTCAATALLLPLASAADSTALRTGLWELTFESDLTVEQAKRLSAKLTDALFAKIPPTQRTELKRLYASGELLRNALNGSDTLCITEEDLEHGIQPATDIDESCTVVHANAHQTWQQTQLICAGLEDNALGKATIHIVVEDPTTFTGTITRAVASAAKPFSIKVELHGKWLDSQCGEEALEEDETPLR
jgi:hypothetical protein